MSRRPRLLIFIVAFHAETTIAKVLRRIPASLAQDYDVEVLIIDDASKDATFRTGIEANQSEPLPFKLTVLYNPVNQGYGGNQKIGYHYAIKNDFDHVVLLHGDGQYAPEVLPKLVQTLRDTQADAVFGSRMMKPWDALRGGMPYYKFVGNRILTWIQNSLFGTALSEFHSGYRAYATSALRAIPFERNTNDFHFDTEIIIQLLFANKKIVEYPIPTYYGDEVCRVDGLRYAGNVLRASLKARLQRHHIFYDRRFDCVPSEGVVRYPSKLDFDSTHSRVYDLVREGSRVLDLGCGSGAVGAALKTQKGCTVTGVDAERSGLAGAYDAFIAADLNKGIPDVGSRPFDYVLALDVIEHLASPEAFLDDLRLLAARWPGVTIILTTGNVGFVLVRLSLLLGRFEYGARGILDLTHTRLFTFATLRRAMLSAGFDIERMEGIVPPLPFLFGSSLLGRGMMAVARMLVRLRPTLFAFQCLFIAKPRPTLDALLDHAHSAAAERIAGFADASPVRRTAGTPSDARGNAGLRL
jgi:glycosyltransferase involved in cell wall biosynthesis